MITLTPDISLVQLSTKVFVSQSVPSLKTHKNLTLHTKCENSNLVDQNQTPD